MKTKLFIFQIIFLFIILPAFIAGFKGTYLFTAHAQSGGGSDPDFSWIDIAGPGGETSGFNTLEDLMAGGVNVMLGIAMSVSVIAIIVSGIKYVMAKGDFKAAAEAKNSLTYAIVALCLSLGAFTIMHVIINAVGGSNAIGKIWLVN